MDYRWRGARTRKIVVYGGSSQGNVWQKSTHSTLFFGVAGPAFSHRHISSFCFLIFGRRELVSLEFYAIAGHELGHEIREKTCSKVPIVLKVLSVLFTYRRAAEESSLNTFKSQLAFVGELNNMIKAQRKAVQNHKG